MAVPRSKLGNHYYQLVDQSNRDDLQRINDYVLADFDILQLWRGEVETVRDLGGCKFILGDGIPVDILGAPFSVLIVSSRVRDVFRRVVPAADFNEVDMSGCLSDPQADYTLINVRRIIRLLDHHPQKREIDVVDFTFDYAKLPPDMHLFLADEVPGVVFISGHLAVELAAIKPVGMVVITVHDIKRPKGHSRALVAPKPKLKPKPKPKRR